MVETLERLVGSQTPRISCVPEGEDHPRWDEIVGFIQELGVKLDPWQLEGLRVAMRRRGDFWAAFAVAFCVPRQNGKNGIVEIRELVGAALLEEKLQIHSAHLADTSKEGFRRLDDLLDANAWLSKDVKHIWRTNGHESIEFRSGCRIRFRTRTRGGGRGFSGSPTYFDEAMFLPEVSMGAILPVLSAQPDPQVWYTGSAVDQLIHEDGVSFARVRERAVVGEDDRLAYMEWSVDAETPDDVDQDLLESEEAWAQSNPALGIRITPDYIRAELGEVADRTFAVERLGVWDPPPTEKHSSSVIPVQAWVALRDARSEIVGSPCFAFDVTPDRSFACIAAAGARQDGLQHVEVIDHRRGTGWVVDRCVALNEKHEPPAFVCDAAGPAASLVHELEEQGIVVTTVNANEHAQACGALLDLVHQEGVRHLGTPELNSAIKGAATRPLGDAFAWSRKNSGVDISPLVSGTLALWGAATVVDAMSWGPA